MLPRTPVARARRTAHRSDPEMVSSTHEASSPPPDLVSPSRAQLEEENRQLRAALESRALIGQATGILMTRLDIDAEVAFSHLRRRSMHENRKLVDIAGEIARIRQIIRPDLSDSARRAD